MNNILFDYDEHQKVATLTFSNGRILKLSNVTRAQGENFHSRHAEEFARCDCHLETPTVALTRTGTPGQ